MARRTTETYDALGRTVCVQNALGHRFTTVYDPLGAWTASIDAKGRITTTIYNLAGQQLGTQDPNGRWTRFTYDERGQTSTRTDGRGWTTTYTYDPVGRETLRVHHDGTQVAHTYDLAGRLKSVTDDVGLTEYTYDNLGRQKTVTDPRGFVLSYTYDAVGNREAMLDQDGGLTHYAYNDDDQLETLLNPFGETTAWDWKLSGRLQQQTLANGITANYTYDTVGRQASLVHLRSDQSVLSSYVATYDGVGNRTRVEELDGTYDYSYDATDQLIDEQRTGTCAYHYHYTYDAMGNRLLMDQGDGRVTTYTYDAADQMITTHGTSADDALRGLTPMVQPPYSADVWALSSTLDSGTYQVEQATVALVGATGTWDASNHWLVSLQTRNAAGAVVGTLATATYDQSGAGLVRLTVPEPAQAVDASATPNLAVAVSKVGQPGPLLSAAGAATVYRNEGGALIPWGDGALGDLVRAPYTRDALAMVLPLSAGHTFTLSSVTLEAVGATGTWDESNRWGVTLLLCTAGLLAVSTIATGAVTAAGQSTLVLEPEEPVEFDPDETPVLAVMVERIGQPGRLLRAAATATFAGTQGLGTTSITYDENGNTLTEAGPGQTVTYTWDAEDRLVQVEESGRVEQYLYRADGLRRRKITPEGTSEFVWDGQNLLAEVSEEATAAQYTDYPGHWGGLSSVRKGEASSHFAYDLSTNTRAVTNAEGALTAESVYTAFGTELHAGDGPVAFGGQVGYANDSAGRPYVRARHYRPGPGLWLSSDPVRPALPPYNLHAYVHNRPVTLWDASGMATHCADMQARVKHIETLWYQNHGPSAWALEHWYGKDEGRRLAAAPCAKSEELRNEILQLYQVGAAFLAEVGLVNASDFLKHWIEGMGANKEVPEALQQVFWQDPIEQQVRVIDRRCLHHALTWRNCDVSEPELRPNDTKESGGQYCCPGYCAFPKHSADAFLVSGSHFVKSLVVGCSRKPRSPNMMQCDHVMTNYDRYDWSTSYFMTLDLKEFGARCDVRLRNAYAWCIQDNRAKFSGDAIPTPYYWEFAKTGRSETPCKTQRDPAGRGCCAKRFICDREKVGYHRST